MKKHYKKIIIIALSLVVIVILKELIFNPRPFRPRFNDKWMIGRSVDEVVERYGEFDYLTVNELRGGGTGFYRYDPLIYWHFRGSSKELVYWVSFDQNGIVVRAEINNWPWG